MSWHVSPWNYPVWDSLRFLDLTISFPILGKFSTIFSSNIFSVPFFFSSSSGTPIIWMLVHFILSQRSLRLSSILFSPYFLLLSLAFVVCRFSDDAHSNWCEVILHCCFDLHFSNNLVMLSSFSCASWPSVCLFWKNVYLGLLPMFWLSCLFF